MRTLVIFDIGDNRLRLRIEEACRDAGMDRRQNSVFWGECDDERRTRLGNRLGALILAHAAEEGPDQRRQALRLDLFPLCAACLSRALALGRTGSEGCFPPVHPPVVIL